MSEIIPTPYDLTIENLEKITGQAELDSRERQIAWWKDVQGAFRSGVVAERKRRDRIEPDALDLIVEEMEADIHPGQATKPPIIYCRTHLDGCPVPVSGKAELRMVRVDAPGFKGEHTGRAKLDALHWPPRPPSQEMIEDAAPMADLKLDRPTKVEYSPDHDPKLGYMCSCVQCHRPLPKIRAGGGPSV